MNRLNFLATSILLAFLVSGCTFTHNVSIEPKLDSLPQSAKSPLHAGVYYSPEFANQEYSRTSGDHVWTAPIGASSVRLFDDLLPRVFDKTIKVPRLTPDELKVRGVDVVIEPRLEHFDFRLGMNSDLDKYSVAYRMTLYSRWGVPVASWIVRGNAKKSNGPIGRWIEDDMNDAAAEFLRGFETNAGAGLTAIANNSGNQPSAVNPKNIVLSAKLREPSGMDAKQVAALKDAGVAIFQVTVRNDNDRPLVVRGSDMRLRLRDGQIIEPASVSSTINILEQTSHTGGVVAGLFGAPLGVLVMLSQDRSNDTKRELLLKTIGGTLFTEQTLDKGQEESGVVIFRLPKGARAEEGVTLTAWTVDPPNAEGTQIEASLP